MKNQSTVIPSTLVPRLQRMAGELSIREGTAKQSMRDVIARGLDEWLTQKEKEFGLSGGANGI